MDDYSHCHYWDNKRACIGFDCDTCDYKKEYYRVNSSCFLARRHGYDGELDCENCNHCAHNTCVYDTILCTQCERCFEDFGLIQCESCVNFDESTVLWGRCKKCTYERKEGYVRQQKYWKDDEFDEDLFEI